MHRRNMLAAVTSLLGVKAVASDAGRELSGPRSGYGDRAASEQRSTRFFNLSATPGTRSESHAAARHRRHHYAVVVALRAPSFRRADDRLVAPCGSAARRGR
jgi:hypothetical protein